MKLLVNGVKYDSTVTPVVIEFDKNEEEIFGMKKFVSAPPESTIEEREALLMREL